MDRVLVLNSDFTPLNVTSLRRGFVLVQKGKAEVIQKGEDIITTVGNFVRPLIIRLKDYVRYRPSTLGVTRRRLFKRDDYSCLYCGSNKNLTIDHVVPKSKGGTNEWKNLATCCHRCNTLKGDKTPEQVGLKLRYKPYTPELFSKVLDGNIQNVWDGFKGQFFG
jgi:CRISPR/Cas system Type II protein with McrA/HNH and RuvC-like nuclease domain